MDKKIDALSHAISFEQHALEEMKNGNASIPEKWSIEKQGAFLKGLLYAFKILTTENR
jgi:hypothetical protein